MRIIAGVAGGLPLEPPEGDDVRPTTDRVKEAWFSSLQPRLPGAVVLDGFAGTGALGLEAASRGAARVVCVEDDMRATQLVERNAASTGLTVELVVATMPEVLTTTLAEERFDVVLLDPPYDIDPDELREVLEAVAAVTAPGGEVWLEAARRAPDPAWPAGLRAERTRRYGDIELHTAVRVDDDAPATEEDGP